MLLKGTLLEDFKSFLFFSSHDGAYLSEFDQRLGGIIPSCYVHDILYFLV